MMKRRIGIVFDSFRSGGISRVGINYIKIFRSLGYYVDAYILTNKYDSSFLNELKDNVNRVYFKKMSIKICPDYYWKLAEQYNIGKYLFPFVYILLKVFLCLKKLFLLPIRKKYDLSIAFSGHFNDLTFVAEGFVYSPAKIAWLHGAQYDYCILSRGYIFLYKKIKNLVVLSNLCDESCKKINQKFNINVTKIYNPVFLSDADLNAERVASLKSQYGDYFLNVGRLANDKDHETLIKGMSILNQRHGINNKLVIVGDGPKKDSLIQLVETLGMEDYIIFEGNKTNVQDYYASAKLFVHSSPLEGLPTVLLEALKYELPIVASDSLPGVREILSNNEYGLIFSVGDAKDFCLKCIELLTNEDLYLSFKRKSFARIEDFSPNRIRSKVDSYFSTLFEVNNEKN